LAAQVVGVRYLSGGSLAAVFQDRRTAGLASYREGRAACHDGAFARCVRFMERAIRLDPNLAPAYAWLAALTAVGGPRSSDLTRSRLVVSAAVTHRDGLAPQERSMVDGLGEMFATDPPDARLLVRTLRPVVEAYPDEEDLRVVFARALHLVGELDEARREGATVIAADREHGAAYGLLAELAVASYDLEERRRILEACMAHVPRTIMCTQLATQLTGTQCEGVAALARRVIRLEPRHPRAFLRLTHALLLEGRPESDVARVLAEHLENDAASVSGTKEVLYAAVAFEYGRFAEADALARRAVEENPTDAELGVEAMLIELAVAEETGDSGRIVEIARRPQPGRGSWSSEVRHGAVIAAGYRAGAVDRGELDRERDALRARLPGLYAWHPPFTGPEPTRFAIWVDVDASMVATDEDARRAAEAFVEQRIAFMPQRDLDVVRAGAVWLRAGRYQEALAALRTNLCDLLGAEVGIGVHVALLRAETLEAMGDAKGACTDYAAVLARWGRAERSATAGEARKRLERLSCAL
jgi:tetratricopeptide (TPR) repeat protein